ncbi:MAG: VPLPA-CTERM sorting domain-containing protein [Nitrospira sp.]|nr:VPLPA-CTERM sorting domain-containing protein [Nitrospira sp.]
MKAVTLVLTLLMAVVSVFAPSDSRAASVTSGTFTMNLDRDALAQLTLNPTGTPPTLYLEEFWDASASASLTATQINTPGTADLVPGTGEIPATGLVYDVTGSTVTNPAGRAIQPTNFTYDPNNVTGTATGQIGLGGVMRFMGNFQGVFTTGDYALEYDATRVGNPAGGSGWYLLNNFGFPIPAWDLADVTTSSDPFSLALSGNLKWSPEVTSAFFAPSDLGKTMGTFTFASPVPLPAAIWLFGSGLIGLAGLARRRTSMWG